MTPSGPTSFSDPLGATWATTYPSLYVYFYIPLHFMLHRLDEIRHSCFYTHEKSTVLLSMIKKLFTTTCPQFWLLFPNVSTLWCVIGQILELHLGLTNLFHIGGVLWFWINVAGVGSGPSHQLERILSFLAVGTVRSRNGNSPRLPWRCARYYSCYSSEQNSLTVHIYWYFWGLLQCTLWIGGFVSDCRAKLAHFWGLRPLGDRSRPSWCIQWKWNRTACKYRCFVLVRHG